MVRSRLLHAIIAKCAVFVPNLLAAVRLIPGSMTEKYSSRRKPCIETTDDAWEKVQCSLITGYWMRAYQSTALIPVAAKEMENDRRTMLTVPMPETVSENPWSLLRTHDGERFSGSSSNIGDAGCSEAVRVSVTIFASLSCLSWTVSGNRNMVIRAVRIARPRLTKRFTCGVPPLPSRFISQAPIGGQDV
jgi:hypothetical protein